MYTYFYLHFKINTDINVNCVRMSRNEQRKNKEGRKKTIHNTDWEFGRETENVYLCAVF